MRRRLTGHVILQHPVTLQPEHFGPGDDVPEWAAQRITAPGLWEGEDDSSPSPAGRLAPTAAESEPPRSGAGSSRAAWAAYAQSAGVDFDESATRDEIIAAVDDARR
jgi:hypothetical protein